MDFEELLSMMEASGCGVNRTDGKATSVRINGENFKLSDGEKIKDAKAAFTSWMKDVAKKLKSDPSHTKEERKKKGDGDDSELRAANARADRLEAERDALKAKADKSDSETEKKKKADAFKSAVAERIELLAVAEDFKVKVTDAMDSDAIRLAVVIADGADEETLEGKSAEYIAARFDAVCENEGGRVNTLDGFHNDNPDDRVDDDNPDDRADDNDQAPADARNDMISGLTDQWRGSRDVARKDKADRVAERH